LIGPAGDQPGKRSSEIGMGTNLARRIQLEFWTKADKNIGKSKLASKKFFERIDPCFLGDGECKSAEGFTSAKARGGNAGEH
jgi:hypothetical protein